MTIERRNPLPPNRYWLDVFDRGVQIQFFESWLRDRQADGSVRVERSEIHDDEDPKRRWYVFTVLTPVWWLGPGLPTIAEEQITTSDDTVQKPDPEKLPMTPLEKAGHVLLIGGGLLLVVMGVSALANLVSAVKK